MMKIATSLAMLGAVAAHNVKILNTANFDDTVATEKITLVKFYAPWCGHCKKIAPEFETASETLHPEIALAEVDCTLDESKDVCSKFGVRGYPTLKLFREGSSEPSDYDGPRESAGIIKFMKKQTQPAFSVVDAAGLKEMTGADLTLVAFVAEESGAIYDQFVKIASAMRNDYSFAVVTDAALTTAEGATAGSLVFYRTFDEPKVTYTGAADRTAIEAFISEESMPMYGEIGPENYQKYMAKGLPIVWAFTNYPAPEEEDKWMTALAAENKGKLSFVKLDGEKWAQHGKSMGIDTIPGLVIAKEKKNFLFAGEWNADAVGAHIKGYSEGTIQPHLKSEPVPESQDEPVFTLVGKNFEEVAFDNKLDVMVEFYAPWCGHCKTLAPKYDALGEEFASIPTVVIAKVDATENDTPIDVSGFPTLFFFPADDNKAGLKYEGGRTQEDMSAYIRKEAKSDLTKTTAGHDEL